MSRLLAIFIILFLNFDLFAANETEEIYRETSNSAPSLSVIQVRETFLRTSRNSVAALSAVHKYDPQGYVGFCFGRGMAAELYCRELGLKKESLRKLFIIGDLRSNPQRPEWRFHITTIAKSKNGQWWAIDPVARRPMPVRQWIKFVRGTWDSWQGKHKAYLYMTPSNTVMPDVRVSLPPDQETGERIIELSFDPGNPEGLDLKPDNEFSRRFQDKVYVLNSEQAAQYFLIAGANHENAFDFDGIKLNGKWVPYNGYFHDLMRTFREPEEEKEIIQRAEVARPRGLSQSLKTSSLDSCTKRLGPLGFNLSKIQK